MCANVTVPSKSTITLGFIDGDLTVGRGATLKGEGIPPKIGVAGTIKCLGDCTFECNVSAEDFEGEHGHVVVRSDLNVEGDVEIRHGHSNVEGTLNARNVDVDRTLVIGKNLEAEGIDVGGSLEVRGITQVKTISVGGRFRGVGEVKAEGIDVGGSVSVESKAQVERIDVGGAVRLRGGYVGKIDVGGSFESRGLLDFNSIDVGGTVKLVGKNTGGDIDVGGSCKVEGDLKFRNIDVGGIIEISGLAEGETLDVGGKVFVGASMRLSDGLQVGGRIEVTDTLTARIIDVGGSLNAHKVTAKDRVSVGGSIDTVVGATSSYVKISRCGKVTGPIHAKKTLIGKRARVEDVYADEMTLERKAEARNLYGQKIRIESDCHIHGEVLFTESLESEERVSYGNLPRRVEKLPQQSS